ncbi:MAG TPA: hypothetical protein VG755_05785 [Nannocystaceae bacterium]|nr:hypothetical protein [Nannocystaceae bacterium]
MRRFIAEIVVFALVQAGILWAVWRACPRRADHYAAASIDKRARLESAPSPRIVLVGGSTVAFGVDSCVFEAAGYHAVNMGHNRSLGLRFMLAQVERELRAGDVVVVAPEYQLLWGEAVDETIITHVEHDPAGLRDLDLATCRRLSEAGLVWIARKLRCAVHQLSTEAPIGYSRYDFDERGDFVAHRGRAPVAEAPLAVKWPRGQVDVSPQIDRLDRFYAHCEAVGARCMLALPPIRADALRAGRRVIDEIERQLAADLDMPIILDADASSYPASSFYDGGDHLTGEAAIGRAQQLLAKLQQAPARGGFRHESR